MNRRTTCMLIGMTLLGLAMVAPTQVGFAQSGPLIGSWKLNLDKSKFGPGMAPRSLTLIYEQDGQNIRNIGQLTDAKGNSLTIVNIHNYDGQPHPSTGDPDYDATAFTRVDANTFISTRLKAGKLIATGTGVVSQDGKTLTVTITGSGTTGGAATTSTGVFDKQ
jgi:hypothetical protein